jgi:hypothetical protein
MLVRRERSMLRRARQNVTRRSCKREDSAAAKSSVNTHLGEGWVLKKKVQQGKRRQAAKKMTSLAMARKGREVLGEVRDEEDFRGLLTAE